MTPPEGRRLSISTAIREGAADLTASATPMIDARVLMKNVLGFSDADLIANANALLSDAAYAKFRSDIDRRALGEPVAYITGVKEFWSFDFHVTPDVLIPRQDTECLVDAVLKRREPSSIFRFLDLGVGSGCILCALLREFSQSRGVGVDRSINALRVARKNASNLAVEGRAAFFAGDWARALGGQFDVIVSNAPYIRDDEHLPVDVVDFEPSDALFAGEDGLDAYRQILGDIPALLAPEGLVVIEIGEGQADAASRLVKQTFPDADVVIINDLEGRPRCVVADRQIDAAKKD